MYTTSREYFILCFYPKSSEEHWRLRKRKPQGRTVYPENLIRAMSTILCNAPHSITYIALSYLWEVFPCWKPTENSIERLSRNNGIQDDEVLRTTRDTTHFYGWTRYQYLWLNTLCIIKDDEITKQVKSEDTGHLSLSQARCSAASGGTPV